MKAEQVGETTICVLSNRACPLSRFDEENGYQCGLGFKMEYALGARVSYNCQLIAIETMEGTFRPERVKTMAVKIDELREQGDSV